MVPEVFSPMNECEANRRSWNSTSRKIVNRVFGQKQSGKSEKNVLLGLVFDDFVLQINETFWLIM